MHITNIFKHFGTITKHRFLVFKLSIKAGIPWRGLVHDLSKYSWTEFSESVKYYQGNRSPIPVAREKEGYSKAWLHHKGRNKHHHQYWQDNDGIVKPILIPYKYFVELICDNLAAGMVYQGKDWEKESQLNYLRVKESKVIENEILIKMLEEVYSKIAIDGIDKVLNKKNLREIYNKYKT